MPSEKSGFWHLKIALRVAQLVQYRGDGEACHTVIIPASRQLYIEGTAIMYNRAFRMVVRARVLTFLKCRYQWPRWLGEDDSISSAREVFRKKFQRIL